MSEGNPDLFEKIDALLWKRAPEALLDKGISHEDFPVLTEVIDPARPTWSGEERRDLDRRQAERRDVDRRLGDRRQEGRQLGDRRQPGPPPALSSEMNVDMERLVAAMEQRLAELFIRQQLRMEEAVRKAIREALDKGQENP
jgi:hypothetical protein